MLNMIIFDIMFLYLLDWVGFFVSEMRERVDV